MTNEDALLSNHRKLNETIKNLAKKEYSKAELRDFAQKLNILYENGYRYSYSQLFITIVLIKNNEDEEFEIGVLGDNLQRFNEMVVNSELDYPQEALLSFQKLYDHITLEIAQLSYFETFADQRKQLESTIQSNKEVLVNAKKTLTHTESTLNAIKKEINVLNKIKASLTEKNKKLSEEMDSSKQKVEDLVKEVQGSKTEIITILGIFAAIILAFSGGISFSNAVLESMYKSSVYKVAFLTIICAFTLFNTIFCLMYIVARMTNRNIYSKCKNGDCLEDKCNLPKQCCTFSKIKKRLPYVFWVNCILLKLFVFIAICWFLDIKYFAKIFQKWLWGL